MAVACGTDCLIKAPRGKAVPAGNVKVRVGKVGGRCTAPWAFILGDSMLNGYTSDKKEKKRVIETLKDVMAAIKRAKEIRYDLSMSAGVEELSSEPGAYDKKFKPDGTRHIVFTLDTIE